MKQTFRKLDENDNVLPDDAPDWAYVLHVETNLIWTRADVAVDVDHAQAELEAVNCDLANPEREWRLPTVEELFSLPDRSRHGPAINTDFFACESDWYWTSTPATWAPSYRWIVGFYDGYADDLHVDGRVRVRAVREVAND